MKLQTLKEQVGSLLSNLKSYSGLILHGWAQFFKSLYDLCAVPLHISSIAWLLMDEVVTVTTNWTTVSENILYKGLRLNQIHVNMEHCKCVAELSEAGAGMKQMI